MSNDIQYKEDKMSTKPRFGERMVTKTYSLTPSQFEELKKLAEDAGMKISRFIRIKTGVEKE